MKSPLYIPARMPLCLILLFTLLSGCGTGELKSRWRERDVSVDGRDPEWGNALSNIGEKGTNVGIMNDQSDLYLVFETTDRDLQRQIAFGGITLWFDPKGGKEKKFGIRYPVGGGREFRRYRGEQEEGNQDPGNTVRELPVDSTGDLEIDGPGEQDRHRMTRAEAQGIDVQYRFVLDTLVYELKIPLSEGGNRPFAIGANPGAVIGLGFETGIRRRPPRTSDGGEEPGEEGREGFGGRSGGFGGRGGEGRRGGWGTRGGGQSGTLDLWTTLTLATQAPAAH